MDEPVAQDINTSQPPNNGSPSVGDPATVKPGTEQNTEASTSRKEKQKSGMFFLFNSQTDEDDDGILGGEKLDLKRGKEFDATV